jgi:hypothetical protein
MWGFGFREPTSACLAYRAPGEAPPATCPAYHAHRWRHKAPVLANPRHPLISRLASPTSSDQAPYLSGTSKIGYPIFIAKPPTKTNITAHSPSQPAQTLLRSKPKPKDKHPTPQRSFASSDPSPSRPTLMTSSRRPCPVTSSRRSTPLHRYCFARPPYCNTLLQARTGPYLFLLRNRSSPRHARLPGNL